MTDVTLSADRLSSPSLLDRAQQLNTPIRTAVEGVFALDSLQLPNSQEWLPPMTLQEATQEAKSHRRILMEGTPGNAKIDQIKAGKLYRAHSIISETRLTSAEIENIVQFARSLDDMDQMSFELLFRGANLAFQQVLRNAGVSLNSYFNQVHHVDSVVKITQEMQLHKGGRFAVLLALLHDCVKYAEGDLMLLAEHELLSAIFGSRAMGAISQELNVSPEGVVSIQKFSAQAILCHGEGEYPELNAEHIDIGNPNTMVKTLHGGVYYSPLHTSTVYLGEDSDKAKTLRDVVSAVSAADKISGMDGPSMQRYDTGQRNKTKEGGDEYYTSDTVTTYIRSFLKTYISNIRTRHNDGTETRYMLLDSLSRPASKHVYQGALFFDITHHIDSQFRLFLATRQKLIDGGASEDDDRMPSFIPDEVFLEYVNETIFKGSEALHCEVLPRSLAHMCADACWLAESFTIFKRGGIERDTFSRRLEQMTNEIGKVEYFDGMTDAQRSAYIRHLQERITQWEVEN